MRAPLPSLPESEFDDEPRTTEVSLRTDFAGANTLSIVLELPSSNLLGPAGELVGRGLVNFDAAELPSLLGRSSKDLKRELGAAYEREVIHRDDLVLLVRASGR